MLNANFNILFLFLDDFILEFFSNKKQIQLKYTNKGVSLIPVTHEQAYFQSYSFAFSDAPFKVE